MPSAPAFPRRTISLNVKVLGPIIHHAFMHTHLPPSDEPCGAVCFVPNQSVCHVQGLFKDWEITVSMSCVLIQQI